LIDSCEQQDDLRQAIPSAAKASHTTTGTQTQQIITANQKYDL
jgi:hypothetical protein